MKILAIGSHPDDIEIGCGGTLALLGDAGCEINLFIMTDGGESRVVSLRKKEQKCSAEILGAANIRYASLPDTNIHLSFRKAVDLIEVELRRVEPDYIFTHHKIDTHQDHRTVYEATVSACRRRPNILCYESLSTEEFYPNVLVDISDFIDKKIESVSAHVLQNERLKLEEFVRAKSKLLSYRINSEYVEGFVSRNLMLFWDFL